MKLPQKGGLRKILWIALILVLAFAVMRTYFRLTDDFRISNIVNEMPYHPEWEITQLTPSEKTQFDAIISQPFSYLGKGAQSYAFVSEDQKYVLKFFKFKHLRPSWFVDMLPEISPFKEYRVKQTARKKRKLNSVFEGYKLGYDLDKAESGLIFIQLNPTNQPLPVTLIDKIGFKRTVDLGTVAYILQYKGVTFRDTLSKLLDAGNVSLAEHRIGQIFDMYQSEYSKGIFDHDHGVMQNTGFVGDQPIHLDVGKLLRNEEMKNPEVMKADLLLVANNIKRWICTNYPKNCDEMILDMEEKLSKIFGAPFKFQQ